MAWSRILASAACVALICLTARMSIAAPVASVVFSAPAGMRPAGPLSPGDAFDRILPSGRILHPTGANVVIGTNALGLTLTPDGRYAIVSNADEGDAQALSLFDGATPGGYSLSVVSTATMRVVYRYRAAGERFFVGLAAIRDPTSAGNTLVLAAGGAANAVYAFDLDAAGRLTPDRQHTIAVPVLQDGRLANDGRAFPATIVASASGSRAYVVDNLGNDVVPLDVAKRAVAGAAAPVGYLPLAAVLTPSGLLVANEGLMEYGKLPAPALAPPFLQAAAPLDESSSLSLLAIAPDGTLGAAPAAAVPMDRAPDGLHDVGGAHPAAIVTMHARPYAFVAMSNVDRIATVALGPQPRVAGGTELRLYDRGPYGTQPSALALGPDDRHLYVALAGIDAVAVLDTTDPLHPHRIGLIPTGWYPTALALSRDGRYLYVANAKGLGEDAGQVLPAAPNSGPLWSTLERIDLRSVDLHRSTPRALAYLRTLAPARSNRVVPQERVGMQSTYVKHVVVLFEASASYDALFGDLTDAAGAAYGPGDPSYEAFGASVTPNLHALARTFALAGNFYADARAPNAGHQVALAGTASVYTEKTALVNAARGAKPGANENPEDYPRAGYIYNSLAARGMSFRDYGDLLSVSGYDDGASQGSNGTGGLGGLYSFDVPALGVLAGHVDLAYPGENPTIFDVRRADEFERDFDPLVKADRMPDFTDVLLPGDGDATETLPPVAERVADGDRAVGRIVEYLSHVPQWSSTAILIVPMGAAGRDHVSGDRSYAIVVSPYAKRHYLAPRHLSSASALKTEEELLGLPALSLGDALATDMSDVFTDVPDFTPYLHGDAGAEAPSDAARADTQVR